MINPFSPARSIALAEAADAYRDNAAEGVMHKRAFNADARTSLPEACRRLIELAPLMQPLRDAIEGNDHRHGDFAVIFDKHDIRKILALLTFDEVPNAG